MKTMVVVAVGTLLVACGPPVQVGACTDSTSVDYKCDAAPAAVKTGDLWTNVIKPNCVTACHTAGGTGIAYGDYTTAAVFQTTNVSSKSIYAGSKATMMKVDPNNLQNSNLWLKVNGGSAAGRKGPQCESPGNAMPDQASPLSDAMRKQIKDWICTGATQ